MAQSKSSSFSFLVCTWDCHRSCLTQWHLGSGVDIKYYEDTAHTLQNHTSFRLWVAVLQFPFDACIAAIGPSSVESRVRSTLSYAQTQGFSGNSTSDVIISGHSLGTVCAQQLLNKNFSAFVLYGGCTPPKTGLDNVKEPTLCMTGELDKGFVPVMATYALQEFYTLAGKIGFQKALRDKPVLLGYGMGHLDFSPGYVNTNIHFPSELPQDEAVATVGTVISSFLHVQFSNNASLVTRGLAVLQNYHQVALNLTAAFRQTAALQNSTWCSEVQRIVSGLSDDVWKSINVTTNNVSADDWTSFHSIQPVYELSSSQQLVSIQTASMPDYSIGRARMVAEALSFIEPLSAFGMECKLLHPAFIAKLLNVTAPTGVSCKNASLAAIALARELVPDHSRERFDRVGYAVDVGADVQYSQEAFWNLQKITFKLNNSTGRVNAQAKSFSNSQFLYCKVLSPAQIVDWMMSYGLTLTLTPPSPMFGVDDTS
eukprot:c19462_g1_i1.p1 GENE.c19462_g1_i1~~c19462_g1_i1.p1  ORF type:complete len:484 (+),score=111.98 c19462_g1_i1:168-1619(+)